MENQYINWSYDGPPFASIVEASKATGLSQYFLRRGCKSGEVPCVKSGDKYLINIPALYRKLGVTVDE